MSAAAAAKTVADSAGSAFDSMEEWRTMLADFSALHGQVLQVSIGGPKAGKTAKMPNSGELYVLVRDGLMPLVPMLEDAHSQVCQATPEEITPALARRWIYRAGMHDIVSYGPEWDSFFAKGPEHVRSVIGELLILLLAGTDLVVDIQKMVNAKPGARGSAR